jgi:hypothetical protein
MDYKLQLICEDDDSTGTGEKLGFEEEQLFKVRIVMPEDEESCKETEI